MFKLDFEITKVDYERRVDCEVCKNSVMLDELSVMPASN